MPMRQLLVRGQSKLLDDVTAMADVERVRQLLEALETEETMARLLDATGNAEGVQIFIGAENQCSRTPDAAWIVSPYKNKQEQVIGAIGIIGPVRMNYARLIPMVDYTAKLCREAGWLDRIVFSGITDTKRVATASFRPIM